MRVLIVDDEEPLRKLLRHWIEAEGATVVEAGTAEEGLPSPHTSDMTAAGSREASRARRSPGARIIAVSDVWDELVSGIGDTPVAPAHALEIMTSERLPHFDPLVLGH